MPTIFNPKRRNAIFINTGGTVSPTPAPPSFNNTKSLLFDGVDEYVDLGTSVNLGTVSTISLWIKHDGGGTTSQTIIGENSYSFDYLLAINWSLPRVYVRFSAGYYAWDGTPIDDTDWHNIIIVRDTTITAKIYFDGVDQGAPDLSGGTFSGNTLFRYLGNNYPSNTQYFSGNIDEVAGWNSALTTDNINDISSTPTDLTSLNPIAWYRNGDNSTYKLPQILMPQNSNKDKVSNYSMTFDGVDDYINFSGVISDFVSSSAFSVSGWFYFDSVANHKTLFSYGLSTGSQYCWTVQTYPSGNLIFVIADTLGDSGNNYIGTSLGSALVTGQWYNICVVYDGSGVGNTDKAKIYINGTEATYSGGGGTIPATTTASTGSFNIGRWDLGGSDRFFTGTIDEVSIYDSALNSSQVSNIYNSGTPTTITGATAYWKLGEQATFSGGVWTIPDQIGSNDGTSNAMTIEDRVGDASNSTLNSVSRNMESTDIDNNTP